MSWTSRFRYGTSPRSSSVFAGLALAALAAAVPARALTEPMADWAQRFHLGGNAAVRLQAGQRRALYQRNTSFAVHEAGIVFDVDVAPNVSFWYDSNLIREGASGRALEQAYVRVDRLLKQEWLNAKVGRTFTPFGEDYPLWNSISRPFASQSAAFTWGQDEGILLFGDLVSGGRLSYAAALQNGNNTFGYAENSSKSGAVKLMAKPFPWLYVSQSWLNLGRRGNATSAGTAEWWLSGFHISPLGANLSPRGPNAQANGASPSNFIAGWAEETDVKLTFQALELSGNFGYLRTMDGGGREYDRHIKWYTGQLVGYLPRTDKKAYLGARHSAVGTFNSQLGYRFAGSEIAGAVVNSGGSNSPYAEYNYNQRDLYRTSVVAGWWYSDNVLAKAEWSWEDSHLITAAQEANEGLRGKRGFFAAELAVKF